MAVASCMSNCNYWDTLIITIIRSTLILIYHMFVWYSALETLVLDCARMDAADVLLAEELRRTMQTIPMRPAPV